MKKKKFGFTLAEVLVTLMIIGVIAAMTIPGLKNSADERERVAQLKKAYSTVANATDLLRTEYGPIKYWDFNNKDVILDEMFIKQFNVAKNCKQNGKCFNPSYTTKDLSGALGQDYENDGSFYTFVTVDGSYWIVSVEALRSSCDRDYEDYFKDGCMDMLVDVNGAKKPNTVGIDIFGFIITKEGAFPMGGCPGCKDDLCQPKSGTGWACTAKLIKTGEYTW